MVERGLPRGFVPDSTKLIPSPGVRGEGAAPRAMVIFDHDCREVTGNHYHRECLACGARWLEQCARASAGRPG